MRACIISFNTRLTLQFSYGWFDHAEGAGVRLCPVVAKACNTKIERAARAAVAVAGHGAVGSGMHAPQQQPQSAAGLASAFRVEQSSTQGAAPGCEPCEGPSEAAAFLVFIRRARVPNTEHRLRLPPSPFERAVDRLTRLRTVGQRRHG